MGRPRFEKTRNLSSTWFSQAVHVIRVVTLPVVDSTNHAPTFPARRVMMMEQKPYEEGSVLMDAEEHFEYGTMEELAELAENRERWHLEVNTIKYGSTGEVIA